ncbi:MAG: HU family DNA-binding protein [Burkholderiales bacterium]|jgi:DNA-binding protein HU-beta|nr:HU family DNA-binding protein [Burkholderiales bacterium]
MTKQELVKAIAEEAGIKTKQAERTLDAIAKIIQDAVLVAYNGVTLPGIGKFSAKKRAARAGHNPATGEKIDIPEKWVPHFSAAKALKDAAAE